MFKWECPQCGRELDIQETECPSCAARKEQQAQRAASPDEPPAASPEAPPETPQRPASRTIWSITPTQFGIFVGVLAAAILLALYITRPDLMPSLSGLWGEDVPEAAGAPVAPFGTGYAGSLEVAGVRAFYGEDYEPKVRAIVVNHSESAHPPVELQVRLRPAEAQEDVPPLASFRIALEEELGPRESREIETSLTAMGTLQSLPEWRRLRVEVEQP